MREACNHFSGVSDAQPEVRLSYLLIFLSGMGLFISTLSNALARMCGSGCCREVVCPDEPTEVVLLGAGLSFCRM
jgi:hypothetical protein